METTITSSKLGQLHTTSLLRLLLVSVMRGLHTIIDKFNKSKFYMYEYAPSIEKITKNNSETFLFGVSYLYMWLYVQFL